MGGAGGFVEVLLFAGAVSLEKGIVCYATECEVFEHRTFQIGLKWSYFGSAPIIGTSRCSG